MKKLLSVLFTVLLLTAFGETTIAQNTTNSGVLETTLLPQHRIIFQMNTADTLAHKQLMKQLSNISSVAPGTQMEVVCHGPGLDMLVTDKTLVADKIKVHSKSGVVFYACEFSLKERNVEKSRILSDAGFVPAGIVEIVAKQELGWSYIKAGF